MDPIRIAETIVSAVKEKAAQIQATGDFSQVIEGYRVCSALVLEIALENSPEDVDTFDFLSEVLNSLQGKPPTNDKKEIVNQISDLLMKLVE